MYSLLDDFDNWLKRNLTRPEEPEAIPGARRPRAEPTDSKASGEPVAV
jgi:hypothetical protein